MKKISFIVFLILTLVQVGLKAQIRYETEAQKLGTQFKITFYCPDSSAGQVLATQAWTLVDELNMIFSDYEPQSELTQLSNTAGTDKWITVSDPLWEVLELSYEMSEQSEGAFDITIGPLSKLWRRAFRRNILPPQSEVAEAQTRVNYKWIHLDHMRQAVLLEKPNMRLDLGGIAKGYIIDRVYSYFSERGIDNVLVDGGGDLYIGSSDEREGPWRLSVVQSDQSITGWEDVGIASSGDQYRYIEVDGRKYSHIIDPRTGYGIDQPSQVVISASACTIADALASTISILGEEGSQDLMSYFPSSKLEYIEKHKL